jgi:tetrahydromethanopterin S-methyltransferase subunit B
LVTWIAGYPTTMLWTILIILAIVALVLFILGYRRRGV